MCDPTMVLGAQAAGAGASVAGAYYSAKGEQTALKAQADIADSNARLSELTAQSTLRQGQQAEQSVRLRTASIKSSQRASMAANGIDLSSDTPINVLTTTDVMGEIDANTTAANAIRSAWGYRTQATNYQNDALLKRTTAASISPWLQAGTSLLSSAGSVSKNYYLFDKAGAFNKKGA